MSALESRNIPAGDWHPGWMRVEFGVTHPTPGMEAGSATRAVADALDSAGCYWSEYLADEQGVVAVRAVPPTYQSFGFRASEIKRQGSYTHARLELTWEFASLGWATLCIDRPDERYKLARAAWQGCPSAVKLGVPLAEIARYVDQFCGGLWRAWGDANPQIEPTPIQAARNYPSRWASPEQRSVIVTLRQRLGILDTSDIPEQLQFTAAVRMIEHLQAEINVG